MSVAETIPTVVEAIAPTVTPTVIMAEDIKGIMMAESPIDFTVGPETPIEERRRQAAQRLGVDPNRVQVHRLELAKLREAGLLVDIDAYGFSMFQTRVTPTEAGWGGEDIRVQRLRPGSKDLFPEHARKLRSLEARARQNLHANSHEIHAFGQYRWLPWSAYETFIAKHNELLAELETVKAEILARYDKILEENRSYFAEVAERSWVSMLSQYTPGDRVMIQTTDGVAFDSTTDHDRFIEYVVQRALAKMPLREEITAGVRIDYKTTILYSDAEVAAEAMVAAQARSEEAEAERRRAEAQHQQFRLRLAQREEERQSEARIEAYKRAELEHAREQLAQMSSPIQEALDGLRANLYDAVASLLAGVQKNGGFRGKASTKAAELLEYWRRLNGGLLQDDELDQALVTLDGMMAQYQASEPASRDAQLGDITSALAEISALTVASARKLEKEGPSRAAALEL